MSSGARRIHRLPQRLDYDLIPAPLDISLAQATEKSPLPAIIVTPSSPLAETPEYYIAFLTHPKPSLRERIAAPFAPFRGKFPFKARTTLFVFLLFFIMVCHLLAHFAVYHPPFDFKPSDIAPRPNLGSHDTPTWSFVPFNLQHFWDTTANGDRRIYIVEELSQAAHR